MLPLEQISVLSSALQWRMFVQYSTDSENSNTYCALPDEKEMTVASRVPSSMRYAKLFCFANTGEELWQITEIMR